MQAGIDRKTASEAGRTLPVSDCLLAALAREQQATVLTSNIKDYPMEDVRVLSLREEAA
jgi:predicted nucleic acid-binding protein